MHPLAIRSIRRHLVRVPARTPIVWGSGVRTGVTRLLVELVTEDGIHGWGETICLLDAIPAVLDNVVAPLALRHRLRRNVLDEVGSAVRVEKAMAEVFAA